MAPTEFYMMNARFFSFFVLGYSEPVLLIEPNKDGPNSLELARKSGGAV